MCGYVMRILGEIGPEAWPAAASLHEPTGVFGRQAEDIEVLHRLAVLVDRVIGAGRDTDAACDKLLICALIDVVVPIPAPHQVASQDRWIPGQVG